MRQLYASQRSEANVEIDDAQSAAVWDPYFQWFHLLPRAQSREDSGDINPWRFEKVKDEVKDDEVKDDVVESSEDFDEIAVWDPYMQ